MDEPYSIDVISGDLIASVIEKFLFSHSVVSYDGNQAGKYCALQEMFYNAPALVVDKAMWARKEKTMTLMPTGHIPSTQDRFRGCLLGLATGDALGTTLEFESLGTFEPIDDMIGGGSFNLKPGQWTDDTSMALCLATSLVECGFDAHDQMSRYVRWFKDGYLSSTGECFDIGATIYTSLVRFGSSGEPYAGSTDPSSAGNGSLMRLAPVPMFYANDAAKAIEKSGESSKTTHGAREAVDACRYYGGLLVAALQGVAKEMLLSSHYCPVQGLWQCHNALAENIDTVAAGSFTCKEPPEIRGTGYVVKALEAALWAFYRSRNFRDGALLAVNLGDDADTTGAIYGQIAGAYYGVDAIPSKWRKRLTMGPEIESLADRLFEHAMS